MRQRPGILNRFWLTVVGLVCTLAGVLATLIALGLIGRVATAARVPVTPPATSDQVVAPGFGRFLDPQPVVIGVGVVGLILGLLALAWLMAQIPRTNAAKPFRLHDDAVRGLTVIEPDVLVAGVEADAETLPGVTKADAVLRGTAREPELTLRLTANDRADIGELVRTLQTDTAEHLATALGVPLRHLAAQVDISSTRRTADSVTI